MTTRRSLLIAAGVCGYVLWHVAALTRSPLPYFDDTFFASIGESFARTGELRLAVGPLWMPDPVYLYGPVYFLAQRFVFAHCGFGIFQSRILGLLGGAATILLVIGLLRAAGVRRTMALAAGLLFALDPTLNVSLHGGRMDTVALAWVLASLLLLLRSWGDAGAPRVGVGVAAGVCAALGVLTTPRSAYLVVAIGLLLLGRWATARTRARGLQLLGWALPIAVLYAVWIAHAFGGIAPFLAYYRRFAGDYVGGRFFVRTVHYPLAAALVAALAVRVASRRSWRGDALTAFAVIGVVGFYALGIAPPRYGMAYAVFMTPLIYLALARLASEVADRRGEQLARALFAALLVFNGAAFTARVTLELLQWRSRNPAIAARLVRDHVPPGSKVIGDDRYYFAVVEAGSDFQYWQRGGSLAERVAVQTDDYGFDYLVTSQDRTSALFRAYEQHVPLVEVATVGRAEPGAVAGWLMAVARAAHVDGPLVADYGGTLFVRADRERSRR